MRRSILIIVLAIGFAITVSAQEYKTGLGIRAGNSLGFNIKHFQSKKVALEGILSTRWEGFDITGLYEVHGQAFDVEHLTWYYGGGLHIGFYKGSDAYWGEPGTQYTVFGMDGILGMEYTFQEIPICLGLDWKPELNFTGYTGIWSEFAFSVRYVF
jgi:hypothetical protein